VHKGKDVGLKKRGEVGIHVVEKKKDNVFLMGGEDHYGILKN